MAGIIPSSGKPMRKQWFMLNEPRGSWRGLRSRLAEDGCAESQVILAKKLLEAVEDLDVDREENAKLGVYWLTKASEQGNLEATEILRKCLATGLGITSHNYYEAKSCLEMSQNEKLARRAAKQLFSTLSNGEDFITLEQLKRQFSMIKNDEQSLDSSDEDSPLSNDAIEDRGGIGRCNRIENNNFDDNSKKLSEAALVAAASSYARGLIPTVSRALCTLNFNELVELDNIPFLQRTFIHPILFIKWLYNWFINYIGRQGITFLTKSLFSSNINTLFLLLIYSLFGTDSLLLFIPMIIYYLSFVIMIISTIQMFHSKCEFDHFKNWSVLFISYSDGNNLNTEEAEYQYCKNNLKPYGQFFLSLLLNLMIYPIIAHQWTPQSEFTVLSFLLTLITLFNFSMNNDTSKLPDLLQLFSFCLNVLAKYPYETDIVVGQTWRFLDIQVPTFASYVVGNGIEFCLNFRVFFYLLIPTVFIKMAVKDNWKGTYKLLIPHCVSLSWWQLTILSSQSATWYGLIRGTLALVGMLLFLPIAGLASILLPIIAIFKYLSSNDIIIKLIITIIISSLPFILSWYFKKTQKSKYNWIINYLQIIFTILAIIFLSWPFIIQLKDHNDIIDNNYQTLKVSSLTWEQYHSYCHQPAWEEIPSKALVQLDCTQLDDILINWEGYVTSVKIKNIQNPLNNFINTLPSFLSSKLRCFFGDSINENELCKYTDQNRQNICLLLAKYNKDKHDCHLFNWNRYEFEIYVKMKSGMWGNNAEIVILADHSFYNFSLHVFPGDKIHFNGILTNQNLEKEFLLGGSRPVVNLESVECILCHTINLKSSKKIRKSITINLIIKTLILGVKTVCNFVLNPLVIFK